jgi:hypothetical protein
MSLFKKNIIQDKFLLLRCSMAPRLMYLARAALLDCTTQALQDATAYFINLLQLQPN